MTDPTQTQTGAPADEPNVDNKSVIFAALDEAGIHKVTVGFDGSSDSGQIEDVEAWNAAGDKIPLPSNRKLQLASGNPDRPLTETNLQEAIETLAWDYLEATHRGWEDNDGAFGTFYFSVPNQTITLEHNERFTDVNTSWHDF
jgi:hypothetical protein